MTKLWKSNNEEANYRQNGTPRQHMERLREYQRMHMIEVCGKVTADNGDIVLVVGKYHTEDENTLGYVLFPVIGSCGCKSRAVLLKPFIARTLPASRFDELIRERISKSNAKSNESSVFGNYYSVTWNGTYIGRIHDEADLDFTDDELSGVEEGYIDLEYKGAREKYKTEYILYALFDRDKSCKIFQDDVRKECKIKVIG